MMQQRAFVLIGYVEEQGRVVVCERTVTSISKKTAFPSFSDREGGLIMYRFSC